jgi:hypothetical protein
MMNANYNSEINAANSLIRVTDSAGVKEFMGVLLSDVTTEDPRVNRWTDMQLYKVTDGTGRYVLYIIGRSVVYHEYKGICNSGVRTTTTALPEDSEPCPRCEPTLLETVVALEEDRYTIHVCANAQEVLSNLRNRRSGNTISGPAQRLLSEASIGDDGIRSAIHTVERI